MSGRGGHRVETFIHLHPDVDARQVGSKISIGHGGLTVAEIQVLDASEFALETGWYCPKFGARHVNTVIRLSSSGPLPLRLEYRIVKQSNLDSPSLQPAESTDCDGVPHERK